MSFIFQGFRISNRTKPGNSEFALRAFPGVFPDLFRISLRKCLTVLGVPPNRVFPGIFWVIISNGMSGVAPANQTKERSVHELFAGAFRNKSSMWIVLVFLRKNTRIHKKGWNSWIFRFGPFFGLVCWGDSNGMAQGRALPNMKPDTVLWFATFPHAQLISFGISHLPRRWEMPNGPSVIPRI